MITLLTDFGVADYFVPAVKGVILTINPAVRIIDLTHDIPPQNLRSGAFTLGACYREFPEGSIHLAVVDPGVGSARRPIIVQSDRYTFVGPDNGLFSFVYSLEKEVRIFRITNRKYFRHPVSATFHGRDIFGPVAGHLSLGVPASEIGEPVTDPVSFEIPVPRKVGETFEGNILHIDRFGNLITSFTGRELQIEDGVSPACQMILGERRITQFGSHFAAAERADEPFACPGSAGYWEITLWCGSAAGFLGVQVGDRIILKNIR